MGKRTRKTRWRTLAIADESDSEESNTLSGSQLSKSYHHRPFYSKFTHSSQSTPTRRFPYEAKSTRSSSTASENKITFNEDEYTKITTPRQDVLFKKGYLSKPKNYQTQTSTGNSTASTGNSTGNGTPDHQSADGTEGTDLEYESQFVFPSSFVDQNGICYINSYEHYPLVMYHPPICYPEYPFSRTKRHSTGSLTESTSPHTEETSQDLSQSGGENTGNGPEFNHVYNVIYPGYYFNGICSPNVTPSGQTATEPRKIKKKRRRKISKSVNQEETSSSEEGYSSDEAITQVENRIQIIANAASREEVSATDTTACPRLHKDDVAQKAETEATTAVDDERRLEDVHEGMSEEDQTEKLPPQQNANDVSNETNEENINSSISNEEQLVVADTKLPENSPDVVEEVGVNANQNKPELEDEVHKETSDDKTQLQSDKIQNTDKTTRENANDNTNENTRENVNENTNETTQEHVENTKDTEENAMKEIKFNLNAEEFVPRAYRHVEPIPIDPNLQYINIHPNFVHLPLINHPLGEFSPAPFNPPFLPPGIPLNFVAPDPKLLPNFVNFVPNHFTPPKSYEQPSSHSSQNKVEEATTKKKEEGEKAKTDESKTENAEEVKKEVPTQENVKEERAEMEKCKSTMYKNDVDIAKIVSKLEEAAKEQKFFENRRQSFRSPSKFNKTPRQRFNSPYQNEFKQDTYKQNVDKRRQRRFDTKPNETAESKQKETSTAITTIATKETTDVSETSRTKSEEIQTDPEVKPEAKEITPKSKEEERKYSPRHQTYKNHNSPRRYLNYNSRNVKGQTPEINSSTPPSNYSDTLKKSAYSKSCPRYDKYAADKTNNVNKTMTIKKVDESTKNMVKSITSNPTSQWISVSNRKKRKNKSSNEDDVENTTDSKIEVSEVFEKVEVPQIKEEEQTEHKNIIEITKVNEEKEDLSSSKKLDNFIELITKSDASSIKNVSQIDIPDGQILLQDIKDIEKELLKDRAKTIETAQKEIVKESIERKTTPSESLRVHSKTPKEETKKKAKKGVGKNTTKRIIILDPDISKTETGKNDRPKPKTATIEKTVKEEVKSEENVKEPQTVELKVDPVKSSDDLDSDKTIESVVPPKESVPDNNESVPLEISENALATPDKKKPKKKKKQIKSNLSTSVPSISGSSTTLNNMDDSYDFLLDTTAFVEEKTNVEVSEELDKMIQKGLFGNLEEKFRSLNVSVDDDFFKSLSLKPKTQSTPDKGFIKASNFTTILNQANQSLPKTKTDDEQKIDIDFSKIKLPDYEPQPSTSKSGDFLEKSTLVSDTGPTPTDATLNTKSNGKLKNKSKKRISVVENDVTNNIITSNEVVEVEDRSRHEYFFLKNDEKHVDSANSVSKNESTSSNIDSSENICKNDFLNETNEFSNDLVQIENEDVKIDDGTITFSVQETSTCEDCVQTINDENDIEKNEEDSGIFENQTEFNEKSTEESLPDTSINPIHQSHSDKLDKTKDSEDKSVELFSNVQTETTSTYLCNGYANHKESQDEIIKNDNCDDSGVLKNSAYQMVVFDEGHILNKSEKEPISEQLTEDKSENAKIQENIVIKIDEEPAKNNNLELVFENEESHANSSESNPDAKPLYPITQAVKEWMTKTRETTPEIELLKSPDTIYKEFIGNSDDEDESDTEESKQKNGKSNPWPIDYIDQNEICHVSVGPRVAKPNSEYELAVFETWSMSQDASVQEDDLLDCWEPEIVETSRDGKGEPPIEEGEDVLEVYEGKYSGKKEDFPRLKTEIEEQRKSSAFPKHGDLPYRAICCSLM